LQALVDLVGERLGPRSVGLHERDAKEDVTGVDPRAGGVLLEQQDDMEAERLRSGRLTTPGASAKSESSRPRPGDPRSRRV